MSSLLCPLDEQNEKTVLFYNGLLKEPKAYYMRVSSLLIPITTKWQGY